MSQRFKEAKARTYGRDQGHFVSRIGFVIPALALMATLPVEAEMFEPGFQPCGRKNLHTGCRRVRTGENDPGGSAVECSLQGAARSHRRRSTVTDTTSHG